MAASSSRTGMAARVCMEDAVGEAGARGCGGQQCCGE
uniref:Uncharacterized protein n=1 Tax=Arundo donax TaxID=35708 RepID=A0A0A9AR70_ARUDO